MYCGKMSEFYIWGIRYLCADKHLMTYCWYFLFYQCFAFEGALSEVTHPHTAAGTEAAWSSWICDWLLVPLNAWAVLSCVPAGASFWGCKCGRMWGRRGFWSHGMLKWSHAIKRKVFSWKYCWEAKLVLNVSMSCTDHRIYLRNARSVLTEVFRSLIKSKTLFQGLFAIALNYS